MLKLGDCLEVMKELPDNSVDSVVTDPPYNLISINKRFGKEGSAPAKYGKDGSFQRLSRGFMGKEWDGTGIPFRVELWAEIFRVLKPGGHLLSFGGTRTYHRMACAVEDAGFEIRDCIFWVYGSGFPKSLNIGKAVDKLQGNEREEMVNPRWAERYPKGPGGNLNPEKYRQCKRIVGNPLMTTKGNSEWEGWGTSLKPAVEPICLARKPLSEKTVAENVLKWGAGGLNIDGCRVEVEIEDRHAGHRTKTFAKDGEPISGGEGSPDFIPSNLGRFPANLIHDGSEEVVGLFPDTKASKASQRGKVKIFDDKKRGYEGWEGESTIRGHNDNGGSAARFFYCAKASKGEREQGLIGFIPCVKCGQLTSTYHQKTDDEGNPCFDAKGEPIVVRCCRNAHPTVKPVSLMRYLCRLITPPNGIVLDPFMGSGSTGIACKMEGFDFIGIEKDQEYFKIAEARQQEVIA